MQMLINPLIKLSSAVQHCECFWSKSPVVNMKVTLVLFTLGSICLEVSAAALEPLPNGDIAKRASSARVLLLIWSIRC
jgi:hypothetical protein